MLAQQTTAGTVDIRGRILRKMPGEKTFAEFGTVNILLDSSRISVISKQSESHWEYYSDGAIELYLFRCPTNDRQHELPDPLPYSKPRSGKFILQDQGYIASFGQLHTLGKLDSGTEFVRIIYNALMRRGETNLITRGIGENWSDHLPKTILEQFGPNYRVGGIDVVGEDPSQRRLTFYCLATNIKLGNLAFESSVSHYPSNFLTYRMTWQSIGIGGFPEKFRAEAFAPYLDSYTTPRREENDVLPLDALEFHMVSRANTSSHLLPPLLQSNRELLVHDYRRAGSIDNPVNFINQDARWWPTNYDHFSPHAPRPTNSAYPARVIFGALIVVSLWMLVKLVKTNINK